MKRDAIKYLDEWLDRSNRKPLLLEGARQTGKTWLLKEFGRTRFENVAYIDLAASERLRSIFDGDFDTSRIILDLSIATEMEIKPNSTLIILDEIQEAPRALMSLKYFQQDAPSYCVAAAGSYMGIAKHEGTSFPVGKVDRVALYPMTFLEFLDAKDKTMLGQQLRECHIGTEMEPFRSDLTRLLKEYLYVGGMPEAVLRYSEGAGMAEVRRIQNAILSDYDSDFSKHMPVRLLERTRLVWHSLPGQLAKENRKFVYGAVRKGARGRDLEECIQWLSDYGAVIKVPRVNALKKPLSSYEDLSAFKLYCLDVGLLGALADLDARILLDGDALFTEFKGALTESYVAQQLQAGGFKAAYWSAENSTGEIDFVVSCLGNVVPIEVKAAENLRAKSLKVVAGKYGIEKSVRISLSPLRDEGWLINIPLWAANVLEDCLATSACTRKR